MKVITSDIITQNTIVDSLSDDYMWDNTPEQYLLHQGTNQTMSNDDPQGPQLMETSLTEMSSSDDEVFFNSNPVSRSTKLKRVSALRKRRVRRTLSFSNLNSSYDDNSPEDTHTQETLNHQGQPHFHSPENHMTSRPHASIDHPPRPRRYEDVQIGPLVQDLTEPLQQAQSLIDATTQDNRRLRARSTRSSINYKSFHNHGTRQPRR